MSQSYLHTFLFEQQKIFEPLKRLDQPIYFSRFVKQIGYDIPFLSDIDFDGLTESITNLEDAIKVIKEDQDKEIEELLIQLLPRIANISIVLIPEIRKIITAGTIAITPQEMLVRILDYLYYEYLTHYRYKAFVFFYVLGIIEKSPIPKVNWNRIPLLFTNSNELFDQTYEWNNNFNGEEFLKRLSLVVNAFSLGGGIYKKDTGPELKLPLVQKGVYPDNYTEFDINLSLLPNQEGLFIYPSSYTTLAINFNLRNNWIIKAEGSLELAESSTGIDMQRPSLGIEVRPPSNLKFVQKALQQITELNIDYRLGMELTKEPSPIEKTFILGSANETNIYVVGTSYRIFIEKTSTKTNIGIECSLSQFGLSIGPGSGDSFLNFLLPPEGFGFETDLTIGYSTNDGLYLVGGSLEIKIPIHIDLGPISFDGLIISVKPEESKIPVELSTTIKAELGPLKVVVENIGIQISFVSVGDGKGIIGPFNLEGGFKPPNGVGLAIDAGVVKGGGFLRFDFEKGEYAGVLQLSIQGFLTLTAIGLISTRPYFSMLIIITAEFNPPFQLSYGFTLNGVGGLLGLNRMVLLDPLRDGVRTGAINSIMFPTDVIANAPRIISDLQSIFPPQEGYFLVGPMAKIGWGTPTLITLSLGVIIQLPDPKIAILGILKMALPTEEIALLKLQVNFLGTIEPANQLITFDASLYDSHLLHTMTLTGDMAVRLKWGDKPNFILSAGGFHPEYEPTMSMPALQRIGIKILDQENARIRVETYFALTSNTVQFGAKADCYFGIDDFSISGELGFDALLQFSPFTLKAVCSGNFHLESPLGGASIRIKAKITGPTPWRVEATGNIEVFGFEFEAEKTIEWGPERHDVPSAISLKDKFELEMEKTEVWHTELPIDKEQLVSVTNPTDNDTDSAESAPLRIHPFGLLVISQKMIPLGLKLDKFGNQKISDIKKVDINSVSIGDCATSLSDVADFFAIAQFKELSDSEKISKPSFERIKCGVKASFSQADTDFIMGGVIRRSLEYEQHYVDTEHPKKVSLNSGDLQRMFKGIPSRQSKLSRQYKNRLGRPATIVTSQEASIRYTIGTAYDNKQLNPESTYGTMAEADDAIKDLITKNEALAGQIILIQM